MLLEEMLRHRSRRYPRGALSLSFTRRRERPQTLLFLRNLIHQHSPLLPAALLLPTWCAALALVWPPRRRRSRC